MDLLTDIPTERACRVRQKMPTLQATPVTKTEVVVLPNGRRATVQPGQWVIAHNQQVLEVATSLEEQYEILEDGTLHVPPTFCRRIEDVVGIGMTHTPEELVKAVERLASIKVGDIKINFTAGQLEELKYRASKRGRTLKQEIKAVVERIQGELFWGPGG